MKERLDRYLALAGLGTRTEVKSMIKKGMISVNDVCAKRPETKIDTEIDTVTCQGKTVCYEQFEYYLFHKPAGCVSATKDNFDKTVLDYIESTKKAELFPVGRLDKDTEGLLLITNDGALAHNLLSPKKHVDKTYFARIDGHVTERETELFREGVDIGDDKPTLPANLVILSEGEISEIELTIHEGRFHQVKRMFEAVGMKVTYLKRISFGALRLDGLEKGEYRMLTEEELALLKNER